MGWECWLPNFPIYFHWPLLPYVCTLHSVDGWSNGYETWLLLGSSAVDVRKVGFMSIRMWECSLCDPFIYHRHWLTISIPNKSPSTAINMGRCLVPGKSNIRHESYTFWVIIRCYNLILHTATVLIEWIRIYLWRLLQNTDTIGGHPHDVSLNDLYINWSFENWLKHSPFAEM